MTTRLARFSVPRGPMADRVDVYSRTLSITSQEVTGDAATLVQSNVRCRVGTVQSLDLGGLLGQVQGREEVAVFPRLPVVREKYELRLSTDATKRWFVSRVERVPSEHRYDMQIAFLSVDIRTGME